MKHRELLAILILVTAVEHVTANLMLMVSSVMLVLLDSTTSQLAQVGGTNLFVQNELNNTFFYSACDCEKQGTVDNDDTCDDNGACKCKANFNGDKCDTCSAGFYNFPACTGRWNKSTYLHRQFLTTLFCISLCL